MKFDGTDVIKCCGVGVNSLWWCRWMYI